MTYITNLKNAQDTMARTNVPIEVEYWEIKDSVLQEKLKNYLKLWFFPFGGGKLSKTKDEQMKALQKFNLTKQGVENRIIECRNQIDEWKLEYDELVCN